ncbi:MAG: lysylphosphatidylglycerol synthase transmembrane domain-containing protein [Usitatibacter sp.]
MKNFETAEGLGESPPVRRRIRGVALFFLKYVVGISLIAWMALTGKLDLGTVGTLPAPLVAELFALIAVQTVLAAMRARYILNHQGIRTSLGQCLLFNCSGILYSAFLPGGITGDAVRAYLFMKAVPDHRLPILGAMFLDRVLGMLSMVTLGLGAAIYMAIALPVIRPYLLAFTAIFATLLGGLASMHFIGGRHRHDEVARGRLPRFWAGVKRAVAELRIHHYPLPVLLSAVMQSVVIHLTAVAIIYLCSVQSRAGLGFMEVFVATPIGLLVNAVPLSPGGLGIGENAFEILYRAIGGQHGAISFLLARVVLYSPALIGLAYIAQRLLFRKRARA